MGYDEATNLWDALDALKDEKEPSFRAESDEAFPVNEILTPEQKAQVLEISDSLKKKKRVERSGKTEMSHRDDSNASKDSFERGKSRVEDEPFEQNAILTAQNELNGLLDQLGPKRPSPKEQLPQRDPAHPPPSHVPDLLKHTRHKLAGMEAFAAFAKDKFQDPELGMRYQKAFLRRINEAMALVNSYANYLSLTNPTRKTNTMNRLLEEVLMKHTEQLEDQQIEIIKKQLTEDLPETTLSEAQLGYIFDSLMQYITHSTPPHGYLGLLTRLADGPKGTWDENDPLQKGWKYVEVLFVFSTHDKKSDHPSSSHRGQGMELILLLVKEIMEKNRGFMEVKPSDRDAMTFISLRLPLERRNVFEFKASR